MGASDGTSRASGRTSRCRMRGEMGRSIPARPRIWPVNGPAATIAYPHAMLPWSVTTVVIRPWCTSNPVTVVLNEKTAPRRDAPSARATVARTGSSQPSLPRYLTPATSSARYGKRRRASSPFIHSTPSTPMDICFATCACCDATRSRRRVTHRYPLTVRRRSTVASPTSSANASQNARDSLSNAISSGVSNCMR